MNNKKFKKVIPFVAMLALLTTFSSCNRGIGCPSDFSFTDAATEIVKEIPRAICRTLCGK